jgi:hypothetical protein
LGDRQEASGVSESSQYINAASFFDTRHTLFGNKRNYLAAAPIAAMPHIYSSTTQQKFSGRYTCGERA